ncbi:MAG TPA: SDR family oxidoreductase [Rhizobiaceae bacterium]|nr:SDR family oxidoreductase [Rhizobiaceae bacterium]
MTTQPLEGKSVAITGAARGIGRAAAIALAEAGAGVIVNDLDAAGAEETVAAIVDAGGRAQALIADISTEDGARACIDAAVAAYGRFDVLCANAGILRDRTLWNTGEDDFDAVIRTHLRGSFLCGREAARHFRAAENGGSIILVTSLSGQLGSFGQTAYAAAKAGITGLVRTWSIELARYGVNVNAIAPMALTRMVATIPGMEEHVAAAERGDPVPAELRRDGLGTPADVAPLFVYLASPAAAHITGRSITIGGDKLAVWSEPRETETALRDGGWSVETIAGELEALAPAR